MKYSYPLWAKTKEDAEIGLSAVNAQIEYNKLRYGKAQGIDKILLRPNGDDWNEFPVLSMKKEFLEEQIKNEIWGEKARDQFWRGYKEKKEQEQNKV